MFTTFTRNLARTIESQLVALDGSDVLEHVDVVNIDALAVRVVRATGAGLAGLESIRLVGDTDAQVREVMSGAVEAVQVRWEPDFLIEEWTQIVLGNLITTEAEYLATPRRGRGVAMSRRDRTAAWQVLERFETDLAAAGLATFTQVAARAAQMLTADPELVETLGYRHAVIDEAQDLRPAHWRMLRALVPAGTDDLFLAGDAHQRIYGRPAPLSWFDIQTRGRSRRLTVNYRTSREILGWCLEVVADRVDDLDGDEESLAGARSEFTGPEPVRTGYGTAAEETAGIVEVVRGWLDEGLPAESIAVFAQRRDDVTALAEVLAAAGIAAVHVEKQIDTELDADAVRVMTMHRAKGLEFRAVLLPRMGATQVWVPQDSGARARLQNLLYVAGSRARERLAVTWTGQPTPLLES